MGGPSATIVEHNPMRRRMVEVFGAPWLYDVNVPAWTRIELIPDQLTYPKMDGPFSASARLLRELDTARGVVAAMFSESRELTVELGWASGADCRDKPPWRRMKRLGVEIEPRPVATWRVDPEEPEEYLFNQQFLTVPATEDYLAPFLIAATGGMQDRGLINLQVGLIDFDRGLALEFYNAKGMTLFGSEPAILAPIYWRLRDWVWDVQLDRCDALFAPWRPSGA